jgi:hypothetical protein
MNRRKVIGWTAGIGALAVLAIGSLGAIPSGGGRPAAIPIPGSAAPTVSMWAHLDSLHQIPKGIEETILVPQSFHLLTTVSLNPGGSNFDGYLLGRVPMSPRSVLAFYRAALPDAGWHVYDASIDKGVIEVIASKAGSNGFYWEVGIKDPYRQLDGRLQGLQVRLLQISFS